MPDKSKYVIHTLDKQKHVNYILEIIIKKDMLYYLTEQIRVCTIFWAVNSLRMLKDDNFDKIKEKTVKFIKNCKNDDGGFGGNIGYPSTIMSTFYALMVLKLYGVKYTDQDVIKYIMSMQDVDGKFINDDMREYDTRLDCCAILSLKLMETWINDTELSTEISSNFLESVGFDKKKSINYLLSCYDNIGGFGQCPDSEAHAAQTFCCVSALRSLGALDYIDKEKIAEFLAFRQCANGGLNGRINKKEDVCYSFWILATSKLIGESCINLEALHDFIFTCEGENGGFSDRNGNECDLYHLMFSLATLSILETNGLEKIDYGFAM